ncbi:hypothetical protein ACFLYN_01055 [Chloroflexota bacterium]
MTIPTPSTQAQRDNLNIGIYLAGRPYGAPLERILQAALGYDPNGSYPTNSFESYEHRFRTAQRIGRDRYRERIEGYFTFNAMPFGQIYVYKVTWYTWCNPQTGNCQIVPMVSLDLGRMREFRDKDLQTRRATARSVRTAYNIEEERKAIERQDYQALQETQARMVEDESLGEILSGWHGLPYADIEEIIPQLPGYMQTNVRFNFQRAAGNIRRIHQRLRDEQANLASQLSNWVMLQTGLPSNAPQLALQDAIQRITASQNP